MACNSAACIRLYKVCSIRLNVQSLITSMVAYGSTWVGMGVVHQHLFYFVRGGCRFVCGNFIKSREHSWIYSTAIIKEFNRDGLDVFRAFFVQD